MEKIHVKLNLPVNDITNLSWGEIINKANAHKISEKCIGQEKQITIGDETYDVVLIGVNHDDLVSGGKATTTWQLKNLYNTTYPMNLSDTTSGGYGATEMHTSTLPSIFNQIQEDVRSAIKPVIKKTTAGEGSTDIVDVNCNLFLLSEFEIFGKIDNSGSGEGTQYAYWAQHNNNNDRRKGPQSSPTDYNWWWERSPGMQSFSGTYSFCSVYMAGFVSIRQPDLDYVGVSFAFCI